MELVVLPIGLYAEYPSTIFAFHVIVILDSTDARTGMFQGTGEETAK